MPEIKKTSPYHSAQYARIHDIWLWDCSECGRHAELKAGTEFRCDCPPAATGGEYTQDGMTFTATPRCADEDRDMAIAQLADALVRGRISQDEWEIRNAFLSQAKTREDLAVPFQDLPAVRVRQAASESPSSEPYSSKVLRRNIETSARRSYRLQVAGLAVLASAATALGFMPFMTAGSTYGWDPHNGTHAGNVMSLTSVMGVFIAGITLMIAVSAKNRLRGKRDEQVASVRNGRKVP